MGSSDWQEADFRLVCATNKDLHALVQQGTFRDDLFYRLAVFEIELPPLRERVEDLELLIETILQGLSSSQVTFSAAALSCLRQHHFPGNVRELRNIVERAVLLADDGVVYPNHLPKACQHNPVSLESEGDEVVSLQQAEERYLQHALAAHQGERKDLAAKLGISERVLYRKLAALRER